MLLQKAPIREPETDFVWVIVPFSRPENLSFVLANFNRQSFRNKRLVLVENGRAVGAAHGLAGAGQDSPAPLVLMSERHQSIAKNLALREIRQLGGGFTVTMDDDDWYGPEYLAEAVGYARTYDIIGKARNFVSIEGNLWLCSRERALREQSWVTGGTIACWAERCPAYPLERSGEDVVFCNLAKRMGLSVFATSIHHYLYRRRDSEQHAWGIKSARLREIESARGAADLGDEDFDIVCGNKLEVAAKLLSPRFSGERHGTA